MKLLIITQVVDTEHPILGFFHRWIVEFANNCEQVIVICLQEGRHNLPKNVRVISLGKEAGVGRLVYVFRFYKHIWQLRHEYDNVFVHMNQIYVILGAAFWYAWGKRVGLWYAHGTVSSTLKLAEKLTNKIFTASVESFRLNSPKLEITGHGIDTVRFSPQIISKDLDLVTVGRITPAKNLFTLIDVLEDVQLTHDVSLTIVGAGVTKEEKEYKKKLKKYLAEKGLEEKVNFVGRVSQEELPKILNQSKVFVTTAQNGSLDKAVLEAMSCGLPVVSMAPGNASLPLGDNDVSEPAEMTALIKKVIESKSYLNQDYVDYVVKSHSIKSLIPKILNN